MVAEKLVKASMPEVIPKDTFTCEVQIHSRYPILDINSGTEASIQTPYAVSEASQTLGIQLNCWN